MDFKTIAKNYGLKEKDITGYGNGPVDPTLFAKTGILPPIQPNIPVEEYKSSYLDSSPVKVEEYKSPLLGDTSKPNVVFPFRDEANTQVTQLMGENANNPQYNYGPLGHEGVDFANNTNPSVTNPIGGINVTGFQPHGYGNWQTVVGASPEELAQMSPEEKTAIRDTVTQYMLNNPANIRDLNIPGKNISIQAHLAEPAPANSEIATGSADLKMGGSGGWDPHLHSAFKDTNGNMQQVQDMIQKALKLKMNL